MSGPSLAPDRTYTLVGSSRSRARSKSGRTRGPNPGSLTRPRASFPNAGPGIASLCRSATSADDARPEEPCDPRHEEIDERECHARCTVDRLAGALDLAGRRQVRGEPEEDRGPDPRDEGVASRPQGERERDCERHPRDHVDHVDEHERYLHRPPGFDTYGRECFVGAFSTTSTRSKGYSSRHGGHLVRLAG